MLIIFFFFFFRKQKITDTIKNNIIRKTKKSRIKHIIVSKKIEAPKINTFSVNPSLYKTRTKLRKTKAVPVSFCMVISSNGIRTKPKHNIVFEKLNFLILNKLMYLASANDVANFANSEG